MRGRELAVRFERRGSCRRPLTESLSRAAAARPSARAPPPGLDSDSTTWRWERRATLHEPRPHDKRREVTHARAVAWLSRTLQQGNPEATQGGPMLLTITQFNLENLFNRYTRLDKSVDETPVQIGLIGITNVDYQGRPLCEAITQAQRNNTAQAILDCKPDILVVEEVEDLWTLRSFNDEYLGGYFGAMICIQGNDPRMINVALCIRQGNGVSITGIRSHMDDVRKSDGKAARVQRYYNESTQAITVDNNLFSRDCLEVDVRAAGIPLTLLINHFKSQSGKKQDSDALRTEQAARVAEIVKDLQARHAHCLVAGDLNVTISDPTLKPLKDLIADGALVDPFVGDPDSWTHFYTVKQETSRLDYVLPSASLKNAIKSRSIFRKGITRRCTTAGERYPTVGQVGTEASDHCPVSITLDLEQVR
jgi:endonuclease/exonuclease/phosphatase family metal-dependent hydrolase